MKGLARHLPRWALLLVGLYLLEHTALEAFGGREKLWLFQKWEHHRYTAMAMLSGTLRLQHGIAKVGPDEQVFGGATYDNWGFGVPLLQVPFQLFATIRSLPDRFFPDRAIYFFYLAAAIPTLWAAFDRLLSARERLGGIALRRHALSWAATGLVLSLAVYPLMSCRFLIYEETVCYFVLAELVALAAFVFTLRSGSLPALVSWGVAAGIGLLVRPTGLIYFGGWCVLLLLERRTRRAILAFAGGAAPAVLFWMYSNWVKTGSPFGVGYANALPWIDAQTPMMRFGSLCSDTPAHAAVLARYLLKALFIGTDLPSSPWLERCHFDLEDRPAEAPLTHAPMLGLAVLLVLGWMFLHKLAARERRLEFYVPYGCLALVFGSYVWAGAGFAWRYVGDFWPFVVLAAVQYVRFLPRAAAPLLGLRLAVVLWVTASVVYARTVPEALRTVQTFDPARIPGQWADFVARRDTPDAPMAASLECGRVPGSPFHNGEGWSSACTVDTFTNVYLGVPVKSDDHYQIRFKTQGMASDKLRVYVNGRIYDALRGGDVYSAEVTIPQSRLASRNVMITVEWVRALDPPAGKLLSIEIV